MRITAIIILFFMALIVPIYSQNPAPSPVDEVGVYYKNNGTWMRVPPEIIDWKTGGVVKTVSTLGVIKENVNGRIRNGSSKTHLAQPVQLLIYAPEGSSIEEYQLIRMHDHAKSREFRTVTGGVFHASGGTERDSLDFESKQIAKRTWIVSLSGLRAGEYGILPPGLLASKSAAAQLGKMYTFSFQ